MAIPGASWTWQEDRIHLDYIEYKPDGNNGHTTIAHFKDGTHNVVTSFVALPSAIQKTKSGYWVEIEDDDIDRSAEAKDKVKNYLNSKYFTPKPEPKPDQDDDLYIQLAKKYENFLNHVTSPLVKTVSTNGIKYKITIEKT